MDLLTAIFITASTQFSLPPNLLSSICYVESKHDVNAYHQHDGDGNSVGICQVKYKTATWLGFKGTEKQLQDPTVNIYYAAKYLARLKLRYRGDMKKVIIAYNQGHAGSLTRTEYSDKVISIWRLANE